MNTTIPGQPAEILPGPILLDGLLQSFLLGTIVNQAYKYLMDYRDDSCRKRSFVVCVIVLSILQTVLEDYKVWRALILHRKWSTSRIEWADIFLNGCICWLCESFYIKRCWKMMEKSKWIIIPLSVLSLLIMATNIYLAIAIGIAFRTLEGTNDILSASRFVLPSTIVAFSFWIFGSLMLEIAVTTILMVSLWKSRTGLSELDEVVVKVIHITWESAILPSICMVVAVGVYHASPHRDDHFVLLFVLLTGKFYTFGMLRTLNSRAKLRERMQSNDFGRTSLSTWHWEQASTERTSNRRQSSILSTLDLPVPPASFHPVKCFPDENQPMPSPDQLLPFASAIQLVNSPAMEAQETGVFRHRICS